MTASELKALRGRGHSLKPFVLVGKEGVTEKIFSAVDAALTAHELVKVKLLPACTVDKNEAARKLSAGTQSTMVQRIGKTVLLFRPRPAEEEEK